MANKKVFTNLTFEGYSELINPKLNPTGTVPASAGPGQVYFNTGGSGASAGTLNIQFAAAGAAAPYDWRAVHTSGIDFSTAGLFTSSIADGNPPLAVTSKTVVPNLTVEALGTSATALSSGFHRASTTAAQHGIPVYGAAGVLPVGTPAADGDAATKAYVDSTAQGLTIKDPVRIATTAALPAVTYANGASGVGATLTADAAAVWTIDGQALVATKRILVKDQAAPAQNGIYTITTVGTGGAAAVLTRATDYDVTTEIVDGDFIFVERGTDNANRGFVQTSDSWPGGTMGSTSVTWTQFSGAGQITAGDGLAKSGDTLSVGVAAPISIVSDNVTIADLCWVPHFYF